MLDPEGDADRPTCGAQPGWDQVKWGVPGATAVSKLERAQSSGLTPLFVLEPHSGRWIVQTMNKDLLAV